MDINKTGKIVSILIVAIVAIAGLFLPLTVDVQPVDPDFGSRSIAVTQFRAIAVDNNAAIGNDLTVNGDLALTGAASFGGMYPLSYATDGYEIVCGTTAVFTASVDIVDHGLTAPAYVIASQVTTPAATGALLYVNEPTGITVTLTSLEGDYTAGTTGVQATYCIVGTE